MNIEIDENEQDLSKIACIRDEEGIKVTIGLVLTVFFEDQLTRAKRKAVADVSQEYIEMMGDNLRWKRQPKSSASKTYPLKSPAVKMPRDWLPDHPDGKSWSFKFHGGETQEAASAFRVEAYGSNYDNDGGLGYVSMKFPFLWFSERAETLPEYAVRVCKRIRPISGYAGLAVIESPKAFSAEEYQSVVRTIGDRFPGLELENLPGHIIHLREGIKGVNWLTILGDRWIREMGGLDYLRARLGELFGFYPYEGGVIIQAGVRPQLGNRKEGDWPKEYVTLARVLKKIQVKEHYPMHFGGEGRLDYEATMAWLCRFDDR